MAGQRKAAREKQRRFEITAAFVAECIERVKESFRVAQNAQVS